MRALAVAFWALAIAIAVGTLVAGYNAAHHSDDTPICYGQRC